MAKCSFAHQGTYGHECGKPAVVVGTRRSENTVSGVYWSPRCLRCSKEPGIDNWGIDPDSWTPYDPSVHRNEWKGAAAPNEL